MNGLDIGTPAPGETDRDTITELAERAMAHARQHRSTLLPHAYEVWYTYVTGEDDALCERIDCELDRSGAFDLEKIEEIYREHFLQRHLSKGMTEIGDGLDAGLGEAIEALRGGLGSSQRFLGSLKDAGDRIGRLAGLSRGPDAKQAVTELRDLARAHAAQTESLSGELAKVRAQMNELQGDLNRLRSTVYLDHLTQLANRRHMDEVLEREMTDARASGEPLSFALCDIDHFKRLNDTYGHAVGDAVLQHFAGLVKRNVKGQDTAARFGGEEFAIIFPRTALLNAGRVTDSIRRQLCGARLSLGPACPSIGGISASFGVTQLRPRDSAEALIERADRLLYRAKEGGRNMVVTEV